MKKICLVALMLMLAGSVAQAIDSIPLQIAIWPPKMQMVPPEIIVSGLKLNLPYGGNNDINGLDIGFCSTSNNTSALQLNLLFNMVEEDYAGLQFSLFNLCGNSAGLQLGAIMNSTDTRASGVQVGLINSALDVHGLQVGLVNYTNFMIGFQVGLVNIITESVVPFFPIVNFCF